MAPRTSSSRCERLCVELGAGRLVYLTGGTLLILGFVIEMIFLGIIIFPYLAENQFTPATCRFIDSAYRGHQFCQDVFARDPSSFPCLTVRAAFQDSGGGNGGVATVYLHFSYFAEATLPAKCASRICYKDKLMNAKQVANLNATLYNEGKNFSCFVGQEPRSPEYSALYLREFTQTQVFHCILWPILACGCGLLLIWLVYCSAGCRVWGSGMSL